MPDSVTLAKIKVNGECSLLLIVLGVHDVSADDLSACSVGLLSKERLP